MMIGFRKITSSALLVVALASCSGGGGGDDGGDNGNSGGATAKPGQTAIRLVHSRLDEAPLKLLVLGQELQRAKFGDAVDFVKIEPGTYSVEVARADGDVIGSTSVTIAKGEEFSIIAAGSALEGGALLVSASDDTVKLSDGKARIKVLHGLSGGAAVTMRIGDLSTAAGGLGRVSEPVELEAGVHQVSILVGDNPIFSSAIAVEGRDDLTLAAMGSWPQKFAIVREYRDRD